MWTPLKTSPPSLWKSWYQLSQHGTYSEPLWHSSICTFHVLICWVYICMSCRSWQGETLTYKNGYISNIHIVVGCTCVCTLWNGNFLWLFWCFRKAMDSQKEMKLLLDMYKSAPKEQKDKVQVFIRFYSRSSVIGRNMAVYIRSYLTQKLISLKP